jgi:hypothetical protein
MVLHCTYTQQIITKIIQAVDKFCDVMNLVVWKVGLHNKRVNSSAHSTTQFVDSKRTLLLLLLLLLHTVHSGKSLTAGHCSGSGVPINLKMRSNSSDGLLPGNNGRPFDISAKIHPIDQMSMGVEYFFEPNNTSGARYQRVTTSCE